MDNTGTTGWEAALKAAIAYQMPPYFRASDDPEEWRQEMRRKVWQVAAPLLAAVTRERDALAKQVERMRAVITDMAAAATPEGSAPYTGDYDATCAECELNLREGHADDCSRATAEGSAGDER